jgi:exopolyphosphatase/guanosine-5'-triphosphate,3'-diphosphate pyrophosphatase
VLRGETVLAAQSVGTRLGTGLGADGHLDRSARDRTLATIREYRAIVKRHGAAIDVIATSALRRATDAADFTAAVAAITGVAPRILSGDEEATYSYLGATAAFATDGRIGVIDVGGGSTELAVGTHAVIERTMSLEIGAVRLAERRPELLGAVPLDPVARAAAIAGARADAAATLAPLRDVPRFPTLLAVGGTVFTAAAMLARDPARDGVVISAERRARLIDDLLARDIAGRRAMAHIRPQRADILPAGLIVVDEACALLGIGPVRVSHADLLAGFLRSPEYRAVHS